MNYIKLVNKYINDIQSYLIKNSRILGYPSRIVIDSTMVALYCNVKAKYPVSKNVDLKCAFYAVYHEIYCFISSGSYKEIILKTAVNRLRKELKKPVC